MFNATVCAAVCLSCSDWRAGGTDGSDVRATVTPQEAPPHPLAKADPEAQSVVWNRRCLSWL